MRRVFMILLLMAAMITVFVGACAEDDDPFPILVVDGLPVTARVYPFHFGNETPNPTDEDLRNVKNAKWTWSMDMDVPQDAKIVNYPSRKPDGRILSPYVTFEGKNGISGTLTYSFSRSEGTEKSISYQFVDSERRITESWISCRI